jgi:hypothetical protein
MTDILVPVGQEGIVGATPPDPQPTTISENSDTMEEQKEQILRASTVWVPAVVISSDPLARVVPEVVGAITVAMESAPDQTTQIPATNGLLPPVGTKLMLAMNGDDPMVLPVPGELVGDNYFKSTNFAELQAAGGWYFGADGRAVINKVSGQVLPFMSGCDSLGSANPSVNNVYAGSFTYTLPSVETDTHLSVTATCSVQGHMPNPDWTESWESITGIDMGSGFTYGVPVTSSIGDTFGPFQTMSVQHGRWEKPTGPIRIQVLTRVLQNAGPFTAVNITTVWTVVPRNP